MFMLVLCSAHSAMKMEAICSSEKTVDIQQTIHNIISKKIVLINIYAVNRLTNL
jgi:hypothetical protein